MASYESSPEAVPAGRPKLMLKKRDPAAAAKAAAERSASASGKPNPFGAARPREETLKAKGVDVKLMDKKIEAKTTSTTRMTRQQREEADQLSQAVRDGAGNSRLFRSFRLIFGRAIISRTRGCFFWSARARNTHVEAKLTHPVPAQVREAEDALREANENEMPENALRETLAAKRKILNDFMEQVAAANMQKVGGAPGM